MRRLTLLLSSLGLCCNLVVAVLLHHFPDEPFHWRSKTLAYSLFASLTSMLGFVGAKTSKVSLVAIYFNYLVINAVLCGIVCVLFLSILPGLGDALCPAAGGELESWFEEKWSEERCRQVAWGSQSLVGLTVSGATAVQMSLVAEVGAYVRLLSKLEWEEQSSGAAQEV